MGSSGFLCISFSMTHFGVVGLRFWFGLGNLRFLAMMFLVKVCVACIFFGNVWIFHDFGIELIYL